MSPLAWKTKRNHQTGQNLRKGDLEITKRMPKENFLKFFNQRQAKKAALRVKREPRRKMNPVKGVKELSGSGLNWKRISNIVFYPEQNSCLQKSQHFTVYTVICFCFFQKHLLNTYKEPKKKKKSLFQIWIFNPKWKSGCYVDKYYSKVQSTGSRAAPCFLAVNHSSRKQDKENSRAVVLKVWSLHQAAC